MRNTNPIPSLWSAAYRAWTDAFQAINRMRGIALVVCLLLLAFEWLQFGVWEPGADGLHAGLHPGLGTRLIPAVLGVVHALILAPFAIAVHRFVLLGDAAGRYRVDFGDRRLRRFASNAAQLALLRQVPGLIAGSLIKLSPFLGGLAFFALYLLVLFVAVRVVILFPAIAVDAARPTWQNASADTKGHSWRVFFLLVVTGLPLVPLVMLLAAPLVAAAVDAAADNGAIHFGWPAALSASGASIVAMVATAVFVALASRLYRALGASLG